MPAAIASLLASSRRDERWARSERPRWMRQLLAMHGTESHRLDVNACDAAPARPRLIEARAEGHSTQSSPISR